MANNENLKPIQKGQLSKEELKKRQRNGGKKSGEVKREKKLFRELINDLLDAEITNVKGETATRKEVMVANIIQKAMKGDLKAFEIIRDTGGEKPVDKVESVTRNIVVASQKDKDLLDSI